MKSPRLLRFQLGIILGVYALSFAASFGAPSAGTLLKQHTPCETSFECGMGATCDALAGTCIDDLALPPEALLCTAGNCE